MRDPALLLALADALLALHLAVILFNLFGMIVIPLGAWRGWSFVRVFWWRAFHIGILVFVAIQAVVGRICFLTTWHADLIRLAGGRPSNAPLIADFVSRLIFWPLPLWVFAAIYVAVCVYTVALCWLVPPALPGRHAHINGPPRS